MLVSKAALIHIIIGCSLSPSLSLSLAIIRQQLEETAVTACDSWRVSAVWPLSG